MNLDVREREEEARDIVWAALTKASRYELPCQSGIETETDRLREAKSHPCHGSVLDPRSPQRSFSSLSFSPSPAVWAHGRASQVSSPRVGCGRDFRRGRGQAGRGSVTSLSHRRADRWFLPCARAAPCSPPNPDPNPPGYCCLKHGEKNYSSQRSAFSSAFSRRVPPP